jgi:hypothetical protein
MIYFYRIFLLCFLFLPMLSAQDSTMTEVGPGVKYHAVTKSSGPFNIRILEIDISNPDIKIKTELARDLLGTGLEKTSSMASRNNKPGYIVLGAINGDYFGISDPTNPYTFLSNSMIENGEFTFGRSHVRSSFGMLNGNMPVLDILNFSGVIYAANDSIKNINGLNQQRTTDNLILYNKFIGASTLTNTFGIEVRLSPIENINMNALTSFEVTEKVSGAGSMLIAEDYILSGHGAANTWLNNNINPGDTIQLYIGTAPDKGSLTALMGGGPRMITNGVRPSSFVGVESFGESHVNTRHPRTAVGFSADSSTVYFITVDGRQPGFSVGMSIAELADYMISIGCSDAVNLDGGGSTSMVVRNSIVNTPSDPGGERSVGNALLAIAEVSVGEVIDTFSLSPKQILIDSTQTKKININGTDIWGYPIEISHSDLTWAVEGINGIVDENGFFIPAETGMGRIIGTLGGIPDTIYVTVVSDLIPVWSFSAAGNNLPAWLSPTGSTERGFAYGKVAGNDRLYVVNRPNIVILDAATGDQVGQLSTAGASGGTFPVNDVEVSYDGIIFAANLTIGASTSSFRVYKWNDESASPENVIDFTGTTLRLGDKFTVVGSVSNNSAVIYAAGAGSNKVFKWTMNSGSFNQTPDEITLSGFTNAGTSPAVYPRGLGDSNFFINGNSIRPKEYTSAGVFVDELPTPTVDSRSNAMRYIESGEQRYLIVYQYGFPNENAQVLDITNGLSSAVVLETTPSLGTNANNIGTSGDIAFREYQQGVYIFYVLATNNGIAAYQIVNENQVPVELTSFSGAIDGNRVQLNWETASETNNYGFEIERKIGEKDLNNIWGTVGFVKGNGTVTEQKKYSWSEGLQNKSFDKLIYRLKQIDNDGTFEYSHEVEIEIFPAQFSLEQNFPNPFNPLTSIRFSIPSNELVNLKVYDVLGKEVSLLLNQMMEPGNHEVMFDASSLASGVYVYKIKAGSYTANKKLLLMK